MSVNLLPETWNLPSIVAGDTLPATNFQYPGSGTLARVRLKVKDAGGAEILSLDSDGAAGMTINTATDGDWDWDMDALAPAVTELIDAGDYFYDLETITGVGTVRTIVSGKWRVVAQITD